MFTREDFEVEALLRRTFINSITGTAGPTNETYANVHPGDPTLSDEEVEKLLLVGYSNRLTYSSAVANLSPLPDFEPLTGPPWHIILAALYVALLLFFITPRGPL